MNTTYGPYLGMHLFWWAFWMFAMISVFGFNVPERARLISIDPESILKRRLAKGEISEDEYRKITALLRGNEESVAREAAAQTTHTKIVGHPVVEGLSFTATWIISYTGCSLFYWIAPDATTAATSKLFHGMSFTQMAQAGTTFRVNDFFSVLTIGAVYTFVIGIIWSLIHSYFLAQRAERRLESINRLRFEKKEMAALRP